MVDSTTAGTAHKESEPISTLEGAIFFSGSGLSACFLTCHLPVFCRYENANAFILGAWTPAFRNTKSPQSLSRTCGGHRRGTNGIHGIDMIRNVIVGLCRTPSAVWQLQDHVGTYWHFLFWKSPFWVSMGLLFFIARPSGDEGVVHGPQEAYLRSELFPPCSSFQLSHKQTKQT